MKNKALHYKVKIKKLVLMTAIAPSFLVACSTKEKDKRDEFLPSIARQHQEGKCPPLDGVYRNEKTQKTTHYSMKGDEKLLQLSQTDATGEMIFDLNGKIKDSKSIPKVKAALEAVEGVDYTYLKMKTVASCVNGNLIVGSESRGLILDKSHTNSQHLRTQVLSVFEMIPGSKDYYRTDTLVYTNPDGNFRKEDFTETNPEGRILYTHISDY